MGKTSRFFKALFGFKSPDQSNDVVDKQIKRRWSFFKSHRDNKPHTHYPNNTFDESLTRPRHTYTPRHHLFSDQTVVAEVSPTNHSVAVAPAATDAVALVGDDYGLPEEWAAIKIQACYRSHLARKALRALKSLVKLQALVRGHIQRKQASDELRRWQALVRVQARARASLFQITDSPQSTTKGPQTPEKFEHVQRSRAAKHSHSSMLKNNYSKLYDERDEKVLEMDNVKSHIRRGILFQPDHVSYSQSQSFTTSRGSTVHQLGMSPSGSCEVTSLTGPLKYYGHDIDPEQVSLCTPSVYAVSSKNGSMRVSPFTSAKSDGSRSCLSGYSDHPNYMAYTESSRAKVRSVSAPRQRHNVEYPSNTKRYSVYGYGSSAQRGSNLRDSFVSKAYPGSGRLDRLGMPVGGGFRESEFSGGYWN